MVRKEMVPSILPGRKDSRTHTAREHHIGRATATALTNTERERKGNWAQKGQVRSVPVPAASGACRLPRGLCCPETTVRKNTAVPPGEFTEFISLFKGRQDRQEKEQLHM